MTRTLHRAVVCTAGAMLAVACTGSGSGSTSSPRITFATFTTAAAHGWGGDTSTPALALRPDPDGLPFANYADTTGVTVADAVAVLGEGAVCAEPSGPCTPTPRAQAWIEQVTAAARNGVCEGMALLALDRWVSGVEPRSWSLTNDADTAAAVVRLFATQFTVPVSNLHPRGTVSDTLATLAGALERNDPVTMGLYRKGAGHTVVPYALTRQADGRVTVYVYDPNWPGVDKFVEFDPASDTWRYSYSTPDTASDQDPWFGTGESIDVTPLSVRKGTLTLGESNGRGRGTLTITTKGSVNVNVGGTIITGTDAVPGKGPVRSVVRGAFGGLTLVLDAPDGTIVDLPAGGDVTLIGRRGIVRSVSNAASTTRTVSTDSLGLLRTAGRATMTGYTTRSILRSSAPTDAGFTIGDDRLLVTTPDGAERAITLPGDGRQDYEVDAAGTARPVDTPVSPEAVRRVGPLFPGSANGGASPTTTTSSTSTSGIASTSGTAAPASTVRATTASTTTTTTTAAPRPTATTTTITATLPPRTTVPPAQAWADIYISSVTNGVVTVSVTRWKNSTALLSVAVSGPNGLIVSAKQVSRYSTQIKVVPNQKYVVLVIDSHGRTSRTFTT